jgi:hypothetical protein
MSAHDKIPDWMVPSSLPVPNYPEPHRTLKLAQMSDEERQLEKQTFSIAFETALEQVAGGWTLSEFCMNYPDPLDRPLSAGRFRAWIYRDEKRRNAFYAAKALAAEAIEDEMLRISDGVRANGEASMDDVARSQLRIQTRWKMLQVYNRNRYGDIKTIEQTVTTRIDPNSLNIDQLREKLLKSLGVDDIEGEFS